MQWLDRIPTPLLVAASLFLGLAPFVPEPHVLEKMRMLFRGELTLPIDIFDFVFHLLPTLLLLVQLARKKIAKK